MSTIASDLSAVLRTANDNALPQTIVDAPFEHKLDMVSLGLGILVLLVADTSDGMIHRIALSNTEMAEGTLLLSDKRFHEIKVPIGHPTNSIAHAMASGKLRMTRDWYYLFVPALSAKQARFNQAGGGIECSVVYPFATPQQQCALIYSYFHYSEDTGSSPREFMTVYSRTVADELARRPAIQT